MENFSILMLSEERKVVKKALSKKAIKKWQEALKKKYDGNISICVNTVYTPILTKKEI